MSYLFTLPKAQGLIEPFADLEELMCIHDLEG
jgi:hypothetical protein